MKLIFFGRIIEAAEKRMIGFGSLEYAAPVSGDQEAGSERSRRCACVTVDEARSVRCRLYKPNMKLRHDWSALNFPSVVEHYFHT